MGLFDSAGSFLQSGLSWLGAEQQNRRQADAADRANDFSAQMFSTRYQTTVNDMKAAGLNPMLAYSQGGGSPPSGQQANVPANSGSSAVAGYRAGRLNQAQVDLIQAQADAASAQAAKTRAETAWVDPLSTADVDLKGASAGQARASSDLANANARKIGVEIPKLHAEITNLGEQQKVLQQTASMLNSQAELMREQGKTQADIRLQLQATVAKLVSETTLINFDIDAAKDMGNIGREMGQLKPILDLIFQVIGARRASAGRTTTTHSSYGEGWSSSTSVTK